MPLFDIRQGRNQTFNSAGNVIAAVSMGLLGYLVSNRSIFFFVVALSVPTILVLLLIDPPRLTTSWLEEQRTATKATKQKAFGYSQGSPAGRLPRLRRDVPFCQRRDAAALGRDAGQGSRSKLDDVHVGVCGDHAACNRVAFFLVGAKSRVVGQKAAVTPGIRRAAGSRRSVHPHHQYGVLVAIQILDGVGAGIFGVVSVLVIADLTRGTGRFNLTLGAISTAVGIGALLSQVIAGSIVHHFGSNAGFLFLAAVASTALGILYFFMPETHDKGIPHGTI